MRRRVGLFLAASLVATPLVVASTGTTADARPRPRPEPCPAVTTEAPTRQTPVQVGDLYPAPVRPHAGGPVRVDPAELEPGNPGAGKVRVGFAFLPAKDDSRPATGTLVPHEGGPGLLLDGLRLGLPPDVRPAPRAPQHAAGRPARHRSVAAGPLPDAPGPQDPVRRRRRPCGRLLGDRADDYTSALSADDTAKVIERLGLGDVDLYGDSYGTFFQQVFAGRHPDLVRSVVLDSAYPTYGESAWYPTQAPAMRRAFRRLRASGGLRRHRAPVPPDDPGGARPGA